MGMSLELNYEKNWERINEEETGKVINLEGTESKLMEA